MLQSQQIKELRQSGKLDEALNLAWKDLEQNIDNVFAKRNLSWVYFEFIKKYTTENNISGFIEYLEKIQGLELPEDETMLNDSIAWKVGVLFFHLMKMPNFPYSEVYKIIDIIRNFQYTKPSESYSFLLKAIHKVLKPNKDKYISFIDWWNLDNLREEDFEKELLPNGKAVMSIAEQVFTAYFKSLIPSIENPIEREVVFENVKKIDEILKKHPDFVYLVYFKVQMLLAIGEKEELKKSYLPFAQKKFSEFWVWDLMSQIVETDEEKLTCLCQACKSGKGVEQMKTGVYLKMAKYFLSNGMLSEAKSELLKIKKIKEKFLQKIPSEVINLLSSEKIENTKETLSNNEFYNNNTQNVDAILFSNFPAQNIFVNNVNQEKKMISFITDNEKIGYFKHDRVNPNLKIYVGDVLSVRFKQISEEFPSKLLTLKKTEDISLRNRNIKEVFGKLKISQKGFGFVDDVFIPSSIIEKNKFIDFQSLKVVAVRKYDKQKAQLSWNYVKHK